MSAIVPSIRLYNPYIISINIILHLYGSKYDNTTNFTDRGACHELTFRMKCQVMQQEFHNEDPSSHSGLKSEKFGQFREGTLFPLKILFWSFSNSQ